MESHERNNLETFHLIWFNVTENSSTSDKTLFESQLRVVINRLNIFNDIIECRKYMESIVDTDRIVIIVGNNSSEEMISHARKLRHISSIYIYADGKNENMSNRFQSDHKVKGFFRSLDDLIIQLASDYNHQTRRLHNQIDEPISINIFNTDRVRDQSSTELNGHFIFSHTLIDILLRMPTNDADKNELIDLCKDEYEGNETRLMTLNDFERSYSSEQALLWYTKESFLYHLLNKALRIYNIDLLFLFRFFIKDVHQQLKQLQCSNKMRVYRSQLISTEEFCALKNSIGKLISMSSFLSTSVNRDLALFFLGNAPASEALQPILFEINADPQLTGIKPFADITAHSCFPDEKEVLMMAGSIFRLESIHTESKKGDGIVHVIQMTLCSDNNDSTKLMYEILKVELRIEEIGKTSLVDFGKVLIDMGKFNEAEKYFHRLLCSLPNNHPDIADCYHGLGEINAEKGKYESSLEWLQRALRIRMEHLPFNPDAIASSHNCIGISFDSKGDYASALDSYNKALVIWKNIDEDHPRAAWCLNNIGVVYQKEKIYIESLEYQQKSLRIAEKSLPVDHPDIAASVHNIGDVYSALNQFEAALEYYERAMEIFQKSRPSGHPNIAYTLGSIGLLYEKTNELDKSLDYLQQSMSIYQEIMPETHPHRIRIQQSVHQVTEKRTHTTSH